MRAAAFVPVFALAAFAQDSSSAAPASSAAVSSFTGDAFPQTSFLTQTDSRGVVTGQPPVATSIPNQPQASLSQPAVATSVGEAASIPAVGTGVHTLLLGGPSNTTRTVVVSANNSTTVILNAATSGASGSGATPTGTGASQSGSGSGSPTGTNASGSGAQSTGAAATMRAVAGGLVGAGAFMAAFL